MNDASQQSKGNGEDSIVGALSERLRKRATEPVGVIDVRYAEEKYLRIARWLARCNALVDHLKSRYRVEHAATGTEHPFFAHYLLGEPLNVFSTTTQFFSLPGAEVQAAASDAPQQPRRGLATIIAERSHPLVEPSISLESFRIRRQPPSSESDAPGISPRSGPEPAPEQPTRDAGVSTAPIKQITDFVFKNEVGPGSSVATRPDAERRLGSPALSDEHDGSSSTVRQEDQRAADASPVSLLPLVRPIDSPPNLPSLLPLRGPQATPQPQSGDTIGRTDISDISSSQTSSAAANAIAPLEITRDSFNPERPELVWRERPVDSGVVIAKTEESRSIPAQSRAQAAPGEFAPVEQQKGSVGLPASAQLQGQEVKAEYISPQVIRSISERVIRAITLDLKLERERRGVTKWR